MKSPVNVMKHRAMRWLVALAFATLLPLGQAVAQTSATLGGTITSDTGAPVANASVEITHVPSGTSRDQQTGGNGSFHQPGLRIGGPYTIRISADGHNTMQIDDVHLSAGVQPPFDVSLQATTAAIEEIVVSAQAVALRDLNNGVGSAFSAADIDNTPTATRDVIRTLLRDPLAQSNGSTGNLSVAGVNSRFNGLAIDGALQQDDFGLGSSTYATARSPINLDAIESASLVASDYDVSASGFTGGLVNLTTKSGTNEFDGGVFYYFQNESMFGDQFDGSNAFDPGPVDEKEYGVTFGGPIMRDRLFFFVSYDEFESAQSTNFSNTDSNNGLEAGFWPALQQEIIRFTGYDPGTRPTTASTPVTSERTLVKLDWNITDLHRASYTYQETLETGSSVGGLEFESAWYDIPVTLEANTLQLFSDWSDSFSTTLRINKKDFERGQICRAGTGVGAVEIDDLTAGGVAGSPLDGLITDTSGVTIVGGCDRFRHANEFNDERTQMMLKADWFVGDHVVTAGVEYEDFSLFNLFVSGGARGRYIYDDYTGLAAQTASVSYQNAPSNNISDAAASWGYTKMMLFIQDTWQLTPDFELGFGFRYEQYDQSDRPGNSTSIENTYGVRTDANLDGRDLLLPRVSFRWDIGDRTTLMGGVGQFAGGDPKVWTSNAFTPFLGFASGDFTPADPTVIPASLQAAVGAGSGSPIDMIDPNFDIPSDWKASLRLEREFGEGYLFAAQYLYTKTEDGFLWQNLSQTNLPSATPTGLAPDGRIIYADLQVLGEDNLTMLTNHSGGENHVISLSLGKRYDNGIDFTFSYAYQDVETVTGGGSSRGISNWRGIRGQDRNFPGAHTSPYQVEHAFKLNFGYEKDFFGTGQSTTRFDVFAQRLSGDVFNWAFNISSSNSLFGRAGQFESPFDNNPLYIPSGASDSLVGFASGFDQAAFFEYIDHHGIPRGGIVGENTGSATWNTLMDLRIQQSIPGLPFLGNSLGDNNFRIVLDIENFLNLLNSDWGVFTDGPGFGDSAIVTADLVTVADVNANGIDDASRLGGDAPRTNCLQASDCIYRFNSFRARNNNFISQSNSVYRIRLGIRFDF